MSKEYTFHCGASVLVDDAYVKFDVKAHNPMEAFGYAMTYVTQSNALDAGSVDIEMDTVELATALGDIASGDYSAWEPKQLVKELEIIKADERFYDLIETLECLVCQVEGGES